MKQANKSAYRKWMSFAVGGLLLVGLGCSLLGEAILIKSTATNFWSWATWGTAALCTLNTGISLLGRAVIERIKILKLEGRL